MKRVYILITILTLFLAIAIVYSCNSPDAEQGGAEGYQATSSTGKTNFVGAVKCKSCHLKEYKAWKGSFHERAMAKATDDNVRGNFDGVSFTHKGAFYRFYRKGDHFMVKAPGPDGTEKAYQIQYTFGWAPLQQYLVDMGKGKLQALTVAWDTQKQQWFSLYPDQKLQPGNWLHWAGGAMNANTMCADCHTTNLHRNYKPKADSFHTTWSAINVSCEACHGPGRSHVKMMQSAKGKTVTLKRIRQDLQMTAQTPQKTLINKCARCHSRREELTDHYDHSQSFMDQFDPALPHPPEYFADGQIKDEDYTYGSFLQSKMFHNDVKCTDCHQIHSLQMKANVADNSLCLQCHASSYDSPKHHFHKPNTKASECVSCHMPGRYYMQVDFRRDHSLRVPRPDLSVKYDVPNACNSCHSDKSAEWAAQAVRKWYGPDRPDHFSEALLKASKEGENAFNDLKSLISDTSQPAIARATAVWYLGQMSHDNNNDITAVFRKTLRAPSPLIRSSAAKAVSHLPSNIKISMLTDALHDSARAVRLAAVDGLADHSASDLGPAYREAFRKALNEYKNKLNANQYFPQGQMNRGQFYEKRGELQKAIQAYRKALDKDPEFNPARMNLAYLLNRQGRNAESERLLQTVIKQEPQFGPAYYSLALLLAEEKKLKQALPNFEKAAELMPNNARVQYNRAIALQTLKRPKQAEQAYLKAIELAPDNPDYRYGISTLYLQQGEYRKALPQAKKLNDIAPHNKRVQKILKLIEQHINK